MDLGQIMREACAANGDKKKGEDQEEKAGSITRKKIIGLLKKQGN